MRTVRRLDDIPVPPGEVLYVVAGTKRQYDFYANNCVHLTSYINNYHRTLGLKRGAMVAVAGTYYERPNWSELQDRFHIINAQTYLVCREV